MTLRERHVYKPDPEAPSECRVCGRERDVHPDEQLPVPKRHGRRTTPKPPVPPPVDEGW